MALNVADITTLIEGYITNRVRILYPGLDVSTNSVYSDLYIKTAIEVFTPFLDSANLNDILLDLSNADQIPDERLERIGENNYNILRNMGTRASTSMVLSFSQVSEIDNIIIPYGSVFYTEDGLGFRTQNFYIFSPEEASQAFNPDDVTYDLSIRVEALDAGSQYNVPANSITKFPDGISTYLYTVTNPEAVTNGVDKESKALYAQRLARWYVSRHIGTKPGYEMDIYELEPSIKDILVIGKNDEEMERDLMTIITPQGAQKTIHIGGKTDIYIKGSIYEQRQIVFEMATGHLKLINEAGKINASTYKVLNLSDPAKITSFTNRTDDEGNAILDINNASNISYDPGFKNIFRVTYNLLEDNSLVTEQFEVGGMIFSFDTPFSEVFELYETKEPAIKYPAEDLLTLTRTNLLKESINEASPYYQSSQELVTGTIKQENDILNGVSITIAYALNSTIDRLREHYEVDEYRLTTTDLLIREAQRHYINLAIQVKMRSMEELTDSRKVQIENSVVDYIDTLQIGESIRESDIVSYLYADGVSDFAEYIKLPFSSFYTPDSITDPLEDQREEPSFIKPASTAYIVLNKLDVSVVE